jgi:hypothetical protein
MPAEQPPVVIDGVQVLRVTADTIWCMAAGRIVLIPRAQLLEGSSVQHEGERGRLVVPAWIAAECKLVA